MKRNNLFKILIVISIACLLLLTLLSYPYSTDGFILPALFSLIVIFIVLTTVPYSPKIRVSSRYHAIYQLRAPPLLLF